MPLLLQEFIALGFLAAWCIAHVDARVGHQAGFTLAPGPRAPKGG